MVIIKAPDFKEVNGPLIFLAGPIQGAEDWHKTAIDLILKNNSSLNIASPRGDYSKREFNYAKQVEWETRYLNLAAKFGAILFWLTKEKEHMCDRAYAQTTRFELAEWIMKYRFNKEIKLFIGIEDGFTGERYLRRRMEQDCPEIILHPTLESLCGDVAKNF